MGTEALYRVTVALDTQSIATYGETRALKAGMALEADIKTMLKRWYDPTAFARKREQERFARFVMIRGVIQFGLIGGTSFYILSWLFIHDVLVHISWRRIPVGWFVAGALWAAALWVIPRVWKKIRSG